MQWACSSPIADLASLESSCDYEEGEDDMIDMSADEDDSSGAVSLDHEYDVEDFSNVPTKLFTLYTCMSNIAIDTAFKPYGYW